MSYIPSDIIEGCNEITCLQNEFLVLPFSGETGFEDYISYKAEFIQRKKGLTVDKEWCQLILTYPEPPSETKRTEDLFPRFFESPYVVAHNQEFEGCFGIDLTSYIKETTDSHFVDLMRYILNHNNITFVLFVFTNNTNEAIALYNTIYQYIDIRKVIYPLPDAEHLSLITCDKIQDYCLNTDSSIRDYLFTYYSEHPAGFDFVDYLVRQLRSVDYKGDISTLASVLEEIKTKQNSTKRFDSFGY